MSFAATAWAFSQHRLTPEEKLVLIFLADFHTSDGQCQVSEDVLGFETGIALGRLRQVIEQLQLLNLVDRLPGGGFSLAFNDGRPR